MHIDRQVLVIAKMWDIDAISYRGLEYCLIRETLDFFVVDCYKYFCHMSMDFD